MDSLLKFAVAYAPPVEGSFPALAQGLAYLVAIPILVVSFGMLFLSWNSVRAAQAGWISALLVAVIGFGANWQLIWISQLRGLSQALPVVYIVFGALLLREVVESAGGFGQIRDLVAYQSTRKELQLILLAWIFASFLQGVTGFGVPVAIVAPLLLGLGFDPIRAVLATSFGHAWAISFGSLGSSVYAMSAATGLELEEFSVATALVLMLLCPICGFLAVVCGDSFNSALRVLPHIVVLGFAMGIVQVYAAGWGLFSLAAFLGSLAGLLLVLGILFFFPDEAAIAQRVGRESMETPERLPARGAEAARADSGLILVFGPYALLVVLILLFQLIWPDTLAFWTISFDLPATETSLGWRNITDSTRPFRPVGEAGAMICLAALLSMFFSPSSTGSFFPSLLEVSRQAYKRSRPAIISIVLLSMMGQVMEESGMIWLGASILAGELDQIFTITVAPAAALGAFSTGSNTSSNLLLSGLVYETAIGRDLGMIYPLLVLAGQNLGGALGSIAAPAKLVVGLGTVGLIGKERQLLRRMLGILVPTIALSWILIYILYLKIMNLTELWFSFV